MKRYLSLMLLLAGGFSLAARERVPADSLVIGVLLGADAGGAIPFPFKNLPGTYNPYPQLNLSVGGTIGIPLDRSWSIVSGLGYKTVSLAADARVTNQKFQDKEHLQYFTGTTRARQRFSFIELPLYAMYRFKSDRDHLLLGVYHAWMTSGIFRVEPRKGFVGNQPDSFEAKMEEGMEEMRFDDALDSWDAGLLVGYERRIHPRATLGVRFSWGLKDIFKADNKFFDYSMLHLRGGVTLGCDLFRVPPRGERR